MNRISCEERKQNILRKLDELKYYDIYYLDKYIDEKINQLYIKRMKEKSREDIKIINKVNNRAVPTPSVPNQILTDKQFLEAGKNEIYVKHGEFTLEFE